MSSRALALARLWSDTTKSTFRGSAFRLNFLFSHARVGQLLETKKQSPGAPVLCARRPRAGLRRELDTDIAVRQGRGAIEIRRA